MTSVLLSVEHVAKSFPTSRSWLFARNKVSVSALSDVSFDVTRGETLGVVGETGCGKSTLARCITRLQEITSGRIIFDGHDISNATAAVLRPLRRRMQMVFQDPYGSLNPRRRVGSIIGDPFEIHGLATGTELKLRVQRLMEMVGLNAEHYNRFPAEFSGGQRQRIGIARAIALKPDLVVCDEPVSALDVSLRAQILNLFVHLQDELGLTYIFISHDLSVVRYMSDRVAVMYLGKIVEIAPVDRLYNSSRHPYTRALLSALPLPPSDFDKERDRVILSGDVPSPTDPPNGCRFHPRCARAQAKCMSEEPPLVSQYMDGPDHLTACHLPLADGEKLQ